MAQKIVTVLEDDLSGEVLEEGDGETVAFALDGTNYEIDLSAKNAGSLRKALSTYVENARRVAKGSAKRQAAGGGGSSKPPPKHSTSEIRDWARSNGLDVPERGRIPNAIFDQFELAHAS